MNGSDLKAWLASEGLNGTAGAARLGVTRETLSRMVNGTRPVSAEVQARMGEPAPLIDIARAILAEADATATAFDPRKAGLKRLPASHAYFGPGMAQIWDDRPVKSPWQRIDGCIRVVHESIPNPIPYEAPPWAGWRGVVTADGRVFDCDTGHEMRDFSARPMAPRIAPGSRLKLVKVKR